MALNEGLRCKKRLWREAGRERLEAFLLAPWASRRRHDLLELLDRLSPAGAALVSIGAVTSVYGILSAKILAMPRVAFALGEQADLPHVFAAVHLSKFRRITQVELALQLGIVMDSQKDRI